jgi:hypothetical protein
VSAGVGDCDGGSTVTIGELITLVNIILGIAHHPPARTASRMAPRSISH